MNILFCAGFAPIVSDPERSAAFYRDSLGIGVTGDDGYLSTGSLDGVKHFGLWPLADAAQSCFGTPSWPADVPVPQAGIEFDVEDLGAAAAELEDRGYKLLTGPKTEPWGQEVARLLSPEGLLVGLTVTPLLRSDPNADPTPG
jgi:catechol 2,3-dioxygenase-like lactoylglutathione lyase family enzyme